MMKTRCAEHKMRLLLLGQGILFYKKLLYFIFSFLITHLRGIESTDACICWFIFIYLHHSGLTQASHCVAGVQSLKPSPLPPSIYINKKLGLKKQADTWNQTPQHKIGTLQVLVRTNQY